jgi:hypothetical protein
MPKQCAFVSRSGTGHAFERLGQLATNSVLNESYLMVTTRKRFAGKDGLPLSEFATLLLAMTTVASIVSSTAQARTRDQVMSEAFGCAQIGDARTWLDCYYGAAQPVRATLGLQSAQAAQVSLARSPPASSAPQAADIRDAVLLGASRCNDRNGDRQWLDCYYAAAEPMRAFLNLRPVPELPATIQAEGDSRHQTAFDVSRKPDNADDSFGLDKDSHRTKILSARMISFTFDKKGIFTLTLSNGQVWRQLSGDTSFAHWTELPSKYNVSISRGLLGSYNLKVRNDPGMFKVHRIR